MKNEAAMLFAVNVQKNGRKAIAYNGGAVGEVAYY